jgi:hypothetical protein
MNLSMRTVTLFICLLQLNVFARAELSSQPTCLPLIEKHALKQKRSAIWTTPIALVGVPVGALAAGVGASRIYMATHAASGGWDDLAMFASGLVIGGAAGVGFWVTKQTIEIIQAVHAARVRDVVKSAYVIQQNNSETVDRDFDRFYETYVKQVDEGRVPLTREELSAKVIAWDQSLALCDGSLKRRDPTERQIRKQKLQRLIVSPKELREALLAI